MIRIVIADDHTIMREGLKRILDGALDIDIVGEAINGFEVLSLVRQGGFDLLLLDLSMPGRSGFEALDELRRVVPQAAVVIMSMHDDATHVREALARGASGFVVKEAAPAELEIALRAAQAGRTFLSPQVQAGQLATNNGRAGGSGRARGTTSALCASMSLAMRALTVSG